MKNSLRFTPVSVCIPTYNGASYLEACLDSVLAQTFQDFEMLIVDDQSTDESLEIAQDYAMRDPRIKVVRNEHNLGLVGNWNRCVLLARGEWIKFLFQDDILEPNCLERMLAVCRPDTSMVVCKRKIIFENVSRALQEEFLQYRQKYDMDKAFPDATVIPPENFCKAVFDNWFGNFVGEPTAVLLNRNVFNLFGFFNPHLIQIPDFEYWIRVCSHTGLIYIPEFLVHFRSHDKGTTVMNMTSRKFRIHLDELVCYHDFVFHPLYAQLRSYDLRCHPPVILSQFFAMRVKEARKIAQRACKESSNPDPSLLEDMEEITSLFPGFRIVKKIPFSLRFEKCMWTIQKLFSGTL